ncbi:BTAD domain-containing putative transcriptional regulator [Nocardia asteroides]|uniref:BTAD domain-containing putative transcriptional regulator n=1 Tax=Nocardia asteroides TaxID=1824 RepID=UPI0037ADA5B6
MGERPADLGGPRQRALLARLVLAGGEVVSTDRLIDDLWAGDPPPKALGALQAHISYLRRALEPDRPPRAPATVLVSEAPGYALRLDRSAVDAWHFERLLADSDRTDPAERHGVLGDALSCWHGEPYAPFATAHWVAPEAARLHELRRVAVERRAEAALALGHPDEALALLHPHVTDHPDRENAARLLALTHYRLGRQLDALATLRRVRAYLDTEFGVLPGPALATLETAILTHAPELDHQPLPGSFRPTGTAAANPAAELAQPDHSRPLARDADLPVTDIRRSSDPAPRTLRSADISRSADRPVVAGGGSDRPGVRTGFSAGAVGYDVERRALLGEAAQVVAHGRARVVWLEGEAGAGKTTQGDALAAALAADGWTVVGAACPEVDGAPAAWAWMHLLDGLGAQVPPGEREAGPFGIARAVALACERRLAEGPVLVILEDVHRADSATLQILRQLVAWLASRPVLVLVTARGSEADAGVRASAAALAAVTGRRLELSGLDTGAVRAIAAAAGLRTIDDDTAERLRARTGGNPLFVREVAKLAAAVGDLHAVPDGVRDVLSRRIARLPAGAARALRLAAVWGDDIDFDTLLELTAEPEDVLIDLVDTVTVAGLVRIAGTDRITFAHALIRDAVYGDIPALRRARLHWSALELLERRTGVTTADLESGCTTVDLDAMAHHAVAGAGTANATRALRYVLAAARRRTARRAHQDAEPLWRSALELHTRAGHDSVGATRADRLAVLSTRCALINALAYGGNDEQARILRAETLETARTSMPVADAEIDPIVAVLTCWRAPTIWTSRERGAPDPAMRADLDAALTRTTAPDLRIRLLVTTAFEVVGFDNPHAFACSAAALRAARELGDPELLCAALNARAFVALGPDLWPERGGLADELLRVSTAAGLPEYQAVAHFLRFLVASGAGRLVVARAEIAKALDCAEGGQLGSLLVVSTAHLAVLATLRGDFDTAKAIDGDLSAKMIAAGHANGAELILLAEMMTGWARGDLAPGLDGYAALNAAAPHALRSVYLLALLDAGHTDQAAALLGAGVPVLRDYYWCAMAVFEARVVARIGTPEAARRLYRDLLPRAGTIAGMDSGSVAFGPVDTVLAELADRLGEHAAATAHRAAAEDVLAAIATELAALDDIAGPAPTATGGSPATA